MADDLAENLSGKLKVSRLRSDARALRAWARDPNCADAEIEHETLISEAEDVDREATRMELWTIVETDTPAKA